MSKREDIAELQESIEEVQLAVIRADRLVDEILGRLDDLEQAAKPQPEPVAPAKPGRWKPGMREYYWWIPDNGSIQKSMWHDYADDRALWAYGSIYQTEATAIYARDARLALTAMRDWVAATGFVPDWETTKNKAYPRYSHKQKQWEVHWSCRLQNIGTFYFGSEASCRAFLAEFGPGEDREDRLKYLLDGGW